MSERRRDLHRELVNAEQALADVKAQLAHEQASRRQWEADYRAEAKETIAQVCAEALREAAEEWGDGNEGFPFAWLHERAAQIERGERG